MIESTEIARRLEDVQAAEASLRRMLRTQVVANPDGDYRGLLLLHRRTAEVRSGRLAGRARELGGHAVGLRATGRPPAAVVRHAFGPHTGPVGLVRQSSHDERMLGEAKAVYVTEVFATVTYDALEILCEHRADRSTASLAAELSGGLELLVAQLRMFIRLLAEPEAGLGGEPTGRADGRLRLVEQTR